MENHTISRFLSSYCYGPADILNIRKGDCTMWLSLQDSSGRMTHAVYHECVYWGLDHSHIGTHLSLVQKISAAELLQRQNSGILLDLQKNANNISELLHQWQSEGLSFYLHISSKTQSEFLVVAKNMKYQETDW